MKRHCNLQMQRAPLLTACFMVLMASWSIPAVGLQVQVISSDPTCSECQIRLTPVVTLGDSEGPGGIGSLHTITQLPDGRYVLSYDEADAELQVFSNNGRFLQTVGRRGRGPGEFEFIRWVRTAGHDVYAFDARLRRQTVFSPQFRVIRSSPFQGDPIGDVEVVNDSTVVMNTLIWTKDRAGFLLHVFSRDGNIRLSFAEEAQGVHYDVNSEVYFRHLSPSSSGGIWSGHRTQYRIDEWRLDGTLRRSIVRRAEWFPAHHAEENGAPDPRRPPKPRLQFVREDRAGRLWTFTTLPAAEWAKGLVPTGPSAHPEEGKYRVDDPNRAYDTVVEVIDLRTGTLLASSRLDQNLWLFFGPDHVVSRSEAPDGTMRYQIGRVSLQKPQ